MVQGQRTLPLSCLSSPDLLSLLPFSTQGYLYTRAKSPRYLQSLLEEVSRLHFREGVLLLEIEKGRKSSILDPNLSIRLPKQTIPPLSSIDLCKLRLYKDTWILEGAVNDETEDVVGEFYRMAKFLMGERGGGGGGE